MLSRAGEQRVARLAGRCHPPRDDRPARLDRDDVAGGNGDAAVERELCAGDHGGLARSGGQLPRPAPRAAAQQPCLGITRPRRRHGRSIEADVGDGAAGAQDPGLQRGDPHRGESRTGRDDERLPDSRAKRRRRNVDAREGGRERGRRHAVDGETIDPRLDDHVAGALEDLRRITVELPGAERRTGGQRQQAHAVRLRGKPDRRRQRRTRLIAEQGDQAPRRAAHGRSAEVGLVRDERVVEARDVAEIGEHLGQHHAEIARLARPPPDEGAFPGDRGQHVAAPVGERAERPRQRVQARRDRPGAADVGVAGADHQAPPAITSRTDPRSGSSRSLATRTSSSTPTRRANSVKSRQSK